ncbi:DUF2249 domain-containing protein [Microvirga yunnanensis]|uniref:DUF2249 domain-containing protein n=1 Tax=Microvirga yunnanensis TaxID=2953740 RepID=UPI002905741E|nr:MULTISPECIES: DUF2249 domain-containing protein [unclassified Microvirga]
MWVQPVKVPLSKRNERHRRGLAPRVQHAFRIDICPVGVRLDTRPKYRPRLGHPWPPAKEHLAMCSCNITETVIDVRQIMPRMRHPLIFNTFDQLAPGEAFLLVNDHDPRPLFYQFNVERPGAFGWDYQEEGPDLWRVRISRGA